MAASPQKSTDKKFCAPLRESTRKETAFKTHRLWLIRKPDFDRVYLVFFLH